MYLTKKNILKTNSALPGGIFFYYVKGVCLKEKFYAR